MREEWANERDKSKDMRQVLHGQASFILCIAVAHVSS
jgi:hypothetical protein